MDTPKSPKTKSARAENTLEMTSNIAVEYDANIGAESLLRSASSSGELGVAGKFNLFVPFVY